MISKMIQAAWIMLIVALSVCGLCTPIFVDAQTVFSCGDVTEIPTIECESLVAVYNSTHGNNWHDIAQVRWLQTTAPCSWHGVSCTDGRVSVLNKGYDGLSGDMPPEIGNLTALTELSLSGNELTSIPAEIGNLTALTELSLTGNELTSVSAEIGNLIALTELSLSDNELTSVPAEIGNLSSLARLYLDNNELTSVPAEIGNLSSLTMLRLGGNELTGVPAEIVNLTALTKLFLFGNELTSVPAEIVNLTALTELSLNNNELTSVPAEIGNLTALTLLTLNYNQLTSVPAEIGNLLSLDLLYLNNNELTSVPAEIGNLTALTRLSLSGNELTSIPAEIVNLSALTNLFLSDNPLCIPDDADLELWLWLTVLDSSVAAYPTCGMQFDCTQVSEIPQNECNALVAIYEANPTGDFGAGWLHTKTPCSWGRITCIDGVITSLDLSRNQLTNVPAEIVNLSSLTSLSLSDNPLCIPDDANLELWLWLTVLDSSVAAYPICAPLAVTFQTVVINPIDNMFVFVMVAIIVFFTGCLWYLARN